MSQKTSIFFFFLFINASYLCWSLYQSSPTASICFFIDFHYTVVIYYLCLSHYLTILISFSCNYTATSHCVIDTRLSSASLPICCCVLVLWKIKYNEMFGCACLCPPPRQNLPLRRPRARCVFCWNSFWLSFQVIIHLSVPVHTPLVSF